MNNTIRFALALCAASIIAATAAAPAMAQDKEKPQAGAMDKDAKATSKDQRKNKILVDNDKVRVNEVTYVPGASSGMLERGPRVARALTNGTLEKVYADGKKEKISWKVGQVRYSPKETFDQKNAGKAPVTLYVVTLK